MVCQRSINRLYVKDMDLSAFARAFAKLINFEKQKQP